LLPYVFAYALPLGFLTAVLLVLGRMSSQNELTAIRSAGISLYSISYPIFLLAMLGACIALWINFYYGPKAKSDYRSGIAMAVQENPLRFIQPNSFVKQFPGYVLFLGSREKDKVSDFWIWELDEQNRVKLFVKAREGNFKYDEKANALILTLYNGSGEKKSDKDPEDPQSNALLTVFFKELTIQLPLDAIFAAARSEKKLSMMTLPELIEHREMLAEQGRYTERIKTQLQIQKNLAMAFSVIPLMIIAIPLALKTSRSETDFNIAIALGLALSYYFLMIVMTWFNTKPHLRPDLLVWLPNIVFLILGISLFLKAARR